MAAAAACKRVGQIGTNSGINMTRFRGFSTSDRAPPYDSSAIRLPASLYWKFDCRQISQLVTPNGRRLFLVDTLALVRRLEAQGLPSKQAEAITAAITEVLNDSLENISQSVVSKAEMQKESLLTSVNFINARWSKMIQEANLSKFKSKVQSSQDHHFSLLKHETEKLWSDIEKMHSELRYEIEKVKAGQRLDLNLERGRIRDELANQNAETSNLTNKLDREIHALRAQL